MLKKNYNDLITSPKIDELKPMVIESRYDGTVEIRDLNDKINTYNGNVFIRPLSKSVSRDLTLNFVGDYLGRPFESPLYPWEIIKSFKGTNKKESNKRVFCSEMVTIFYQNYANILKPNILSCNVLPEHYYGQNSNINKLIYSNESLYKFTDIKPLRLQYNFTEQQLTGNNSWGKFVKWILK